MPTLPKTSPLLQLALTKTINLGTLLLVAVLLACCSLHTAYAQAITDPLDVQVLKNLSQKYDIDSWTFDDDPCGSKGQSIFVGYMKCVCTYNNGSTCHVVEIYVFGKGLRGTFPMDVFNLKYLTRLDFGQNFLYGPIPPEVGNLTGLIHFGAGTNLLTGTIPRELGNLINLIELYLDSNYLSGEIPAELSGLTKISTLWLLDNNFSGPIPDIFGNMKSLSDLRVYGNSFRGPIPSSIQNLTRLNSLYIGDLRNGGAFPEGLASLQNLTVLSLRNNGLTGSIPPDLGNLSSLNTLDLSFNALTGSVPSSLGNLPALNSLLLGSNNLSGLLPSSLFQNTSLKTLDLSFNRLEGSWNQVPENMDLNPIWNSFDASAGSTALLLDCARNSSCAGLINENSNFAINVGGLAHNTSSVNYEADNQSALIYTAPSKAWLGSISGGTKLITASGEIKGTSDPFLFISARQVTSSLRYLGVGMRNGAYTVELEFAEIGFDDSTVGRRLFDVYIQGILVLQDFNIQKAANGTYKASVQSFPANVSNNILDIHFFWAGKGTCCIPTGYQDYGPLVSAIYVYSDLPLAEEENGHSSNKTAIIASVCTGAAILFVLVLFILTRRKRKQKARHQTLAGKDLVSFEGTPTLYSYNDMRSATEDFHPHNKLGQGGFGVVYKGVLQDGSFVAIKELSAGSLQGREEFINEVNVITGVQHRNLVKLKGCCLEGAQPILVYEYLENRSLDQILFEPHDTIFLDWPTRFNIIIGIARGLAYLHEESQPRIIHRDIKASNILLDTKLQPKIADFGLARLFVEDASHITTRIAGTRGYMAPEYAYRGKLTVKADVYSFGIVVLEIVSGRKNTDTKACEEQEYLVDWTWNLHEQGHLLNVTDSRLNKDYNEDEVLRVIHVGMLCVLPSARMRPTMTRAISMLMGDVEVGALPSKPEYFNDVGMASRQQDVYTSGTSSGMSSATQTHTSQSPSVSQPSAYSSEYLAGR